MGRSESNDVLVSVCITTFQHINYIKQSLDSVLSQKVDFNYEIILGEDDSTDGTREICIDYAANFPDKIRLFLRDRKNAVYIDGKITGRYNFIENLKSARGKYIALLDGDDYWTDDNKLQKQVNFLENNPNINICAHRFSVDYYGKVVLLKQKANMILTQKDLVEENILRTCTILFRNNNYNFGERWFLYPVADWLLYMKLLSNGNAYVMQDIMAIYRQHEGGIWSTVNAKCKKEILIKIYKLFKEDFPHLIPFIDNQLNILKNKKLFKQSLWSRLQWKVHNLTIAMLGKK